MKFADVRAARAPLVIVECPPSIWAQTWTERPLDVVRIGLRSLSETTLGEVTGAAMTRANTLAPGGDETSSLWVDAYNAAVQLSAVGRAACQPDCADVPWWEYPDLQAPQQLSPAGAAWLYARLSAAVVSSSVLASEEAPDGLLVALLARSASFDALAPARRSQVSRHLRAALDALGGG